MDKFTVVRICVNEILNPQSSARDGTAVYVTPVHVTRVVSGKSL